MRRRRRNARAEAARTLACAQVRASARARIVFCVRAHNVCVRISVQTCAQPNKTPKSLPIVDDGRLGQTPHNDHVHRLTRSRSIRKTRQAASKRTNAHKHQTQRHRPRPSDHSCDSVDESATSPDSPCTVCAYTRQPQLAAPRAHNSRPVRV